MTAEDFKALEPFFDKWYIESKAAEGKNSVVYKAFCVENGEKKHRAIRVIKFPGSNEEISRALDSERFETVSQYLEYAEKTVCENIEKMYRFRDNKNIVHFDDYTVVKESSCFYIILLTEFLTPLSDYIKENRIRQKDVVKIGWDICSALESFRLEGITHLNIKPENIYIDSQSNYKLGDFGIDGKYRIKSGLSAYTAPEAGTDKEIISADIYALGMVLYRLLNNNRAPFLPEYPAPVSFEDRERAAARRLRGDMFPAPANGDSKLARIIFTSTAFKAEERFDSPADMKLALEDYVKNVLTASASAEPVNTKPTHFVPTVTDKPKRTDGAQSVTVRDKAAFAEAFKDDDEVPEEKNYKKWYWLIGVLAVVLVVLIVVFINILNGDDDKDIVFSPDYSDTTTTQQETTEEETTEAETTEEETTEEETTQEETTEEETTEEESTQEETTEEETTEEETTQDSTAEEETTAASEIVAGTADSAGRVYYDISDYYVIYTPQSQDDTEIIIELNNLPEANPMPGNTVYIYTTAGSTIIDRSALDMTIVPGDQESYLCYLTITDEYFLYLPDEYSYYIVLTAGAIETNSTVNTETKIDL